MWSRRKGRVLLILITMVFLPLVLTQALSPVDFQGMGQAPVSFRNTAGQELVWIPAGSFQMGSRVGEYGRGFNELSPRAVTLKRGFYLSQHEVTLGQFAAFVEATGYVTEAERNPARTVGVDPLSGDLSSRPGLSWRDPGLPGFVPSPQHPVVMLSWSDAEAFCSWLSQVEGRTYRLPTEAEWEYAARASTTTPFWTGTKPLGLRFAANVADQSLARKLPELESAEKWSDGFPFLAPVGSFQSNPLGLHDMLGNVWEWTSDLHLDDGLAMTGPDLSGFRSIRGGGWLNPAPQNRSAQRVYFQPAFTASPLSGFRVALSG